MDCADSDRIEIRFPPKLDYLCPLRRFFEDLARLLGFPSKEIDGIVMAVDEAVANSIKYSLNASEPLHVTVDITPDTLVIGILDAGEDFRERFFEELEIEVHLHEMRERGLGIHIIKTFMDAVDYQRTEDRNLLTLIKRLP